MTRLALLFLSACPLFGIDEARLLMAIAYVETGNNPAAIGHAGERGEVQMLPAMRRHYGTPLAMLRDLERQLPRAGMDGTSEYQVALAWHCGITRIRHRAITEADADYARRVVALTCSQGFTP
jgi:hypothetical protein